MALENLLAEIEANLPEANLVALKRVEADMKRRIFQQGQATNGSQLDTFSRPRVGRYSLRYGRVRQEAGRRTDIKDLEFKGDLRKAITIGLNRGQLVLGYQYDLARLISQGQEEQTKQVIFEPSDEELQDAAEIFMNRLFR